MHVCTYLVFCPLQRDAARWCDFETLLSLLVVSQHAYHTGSPALYHRINRQKIKDIKSMSDFRRLVTENCFVSQAMSSTSTGGLHVDHTLEMGVQASKNMVAVGNGMLTTFSRKISDGCNESAKRWNSLDSYTKLNPPEVSPSTLGQSTLHQKKHNYMYDHTRAYLHKTKLMEIGASPRHPHTGELLPTDKLVSPSGEAVVQSYAYDGGITVGYKVSTCCIHLPLWLYLMLHAYC